MPSWGEAQRLAYTCLDRTSRLTEAISERNMERAIALRREIEETALSIEEALWWEGKE